MTDALPKTSAYPGTGETILTENVQAETTLASLIATLERVKARAAESGIAPDHVQVLLWHALPDQERSGDAHPELLSDDVDFNLEKCDDPRSLLLNIEAW